MLVPTEVSPEISTVDPGNPVDLQFLLPGQWWHIRLTDAESTKRQAAAMTRALIGPQDDRARLRHDLAAMVRDGALAAQDADATDFYFAVEIVPGVPIPASLAVFRPELPPRLSVGAGPNVAADSLAASLRRSQPDAEVEQLGDDHVGIVRTAKTIAGQQLSAAGVDGSRSLVVSYWVLRDAEPRPVLLSFSTVLADHAEEMIDLFDAIVSTVEWS